MPLFYYNMTKLIYEDIQALKHNTKECLRSKTPLLADGNTPRILPNGNRKVASVCISVCISKDEISSAIHRIYTKHTKHVQYLTLRKK